MFLVKRNLLKGEFTEKVPFLGFSVRISCKNLKNIDEITYSAKKILKLNLIHQAKYRFS